MKKTNFTIIATIFASFAVAMIAFQPTNAEASSNVSPTSTPKLRKARNVPAPTPSPATRKIGAKKPSNFSFGAQPQPTTSRSKKPRRNKNR